MIALMLSAGTVRLAAACLSDADCNQCAGELCFKNANVTDGICSTAHAPINCDDTNVCTVDVCTPATGQCVHDAVAGCCARDTDCSVCTGNGCRLDSHTCGQTSGPLDCDDHDLCTADTCSGDTGCHHDAIAGCCHAGDLCADNDACTVDACGPNAACTHTPASGVAGILCLCDAPPAACAGVTLPRRVIRRYARGCSLAAHAQQRKGGRKRRLLARAGEVFRRAARSTARAPRPRLPLDCRLELATVLGTAQGRARALRNK